MLKRLILTLSIVLSTSLFFPERAKADDSYVYQELQTSYSGNSKCISERNITASSYPIKSSSITTSAYCTLFFYQTSGYPKSVITNGLPTVIYGEWNKIWEGRIQATRQNNLDLNYIIKIPPATTLLSPTEYRYRFALCEDPNAQTSRQLKTPSSQSCRTYQVTSVGATISRTPEQTSNPTPQQTSNPTPQQTSNPTPQQTSNPAPQQTSNPAPQPTKTIDSYTPPMPDFSNYYEENKEIEKRVRQELINEIKITKQFTCKKYSRWNNFSNIAPPTFNEDGEMCMDYNSITSEETRVANVYPRYTVNNLIEVGSVPSSGLEGSKVSVYAIESKKKSKLIFKGKLKKESRSDMSCQFNPPTDYWGIQGCNYIYEGAFLTVKIPKKMGTYPNLKQRVKIVIENKNSIDKKITWYISKNGMVEE
jgi:hypothetical protein